MYQSDGIATHYLYISGPNGLREPTGLLCLGVASHSARKDIVHNALKNGEMLAKVPKSVNSLGELRHCLKASGR